jgi:hypothetical protein
MRIAWHEGQIVPIFSEGTLSLNERIDNHCEEADRVVQDVMARGGLDVPTDWSASHVVDIRMIRFDMLLLLLDIPEWSIDAELVYMNWRNGI